MLTAIIRKEVLQHLPSFSFLTGSLLMVLLSALAALVATLDLEQRAVAYRTQLEQHDLRLKERHRVYSYLQPVVVRPPEPLSVFARGVEGRFENQVKIHVYEVPGHRAAEYRRNPFMNRLYDLDITAIVRDVLGLLALLLTFDALVGERERGNFVLVLAQGARRSTLLVGKFLGAFLALSLPLLASVLVSLAILLSRGTVDFEPRHAWRLAALVGGYGAYLAVMLMVGLALSVWSKSASRALTSSLLVWAVVVVLYPQMITAAFGELAARKGAPHEVEKAVRQEEKKLEDRLQEVWNQEPLLTRATGHRSTYRFSRADRAVLWRFGSARYYDAVARYHRQEVLLGEKTAERIFEIRQEDAWMRRKVEREGEVLASLSPASLLDQLAESLAGTSFDDYEAFLDGCRVYREKFLDFLEREGAVGSWRWFTDDPSGEWPWPRFLGMDPDEVDESNYDELFGRYVQPELRARRLEVEKELFGGEDPAWSKTLAAMPRFHFTAVSLFEAVRREALELVLFHLFGIVVAWSLWRRFRAYDPE